MRTKPRATEWSAGGQANPAGGVGGEDQWGQANSVGGGEARQCFPEGVEITCNGFQILSGVLGVGLEQF